MSKITDLLLQQCLNALSHNNIRIDDNSQRYEDSWLYYLQKRPLNIERSADEDENTLRDYVEPVVYNAVSATVPQVLDIFTEAEDNAVEFRDKSFRYNPILQEIINSQINKIVLQENDGYKVLEVALKETLITGDGFSKVYIQEDYTEDTLELEEWVGFENLITTLGEGNWQFDLPQAIADGEKSGKDGSVEWRTTPNDFQIKGTLSIYKVDKKAVIENVGLKDLIIDTTCGPDFNKCRYICHKMNMTVGEAMKMGYKKSALMNASTSERIGESQYNKFTLITADQIGNNTYFSDDGGDDLERYITIYEHYIYSSHPSKGKESKLYQVHTTNTELLDYTEVSEHPFVHGQMEIIPDSFWGRSMYDICKGYQDQESTLQRAAIKNLISAAYGRMLVVDSQFDEESVINSNNPGAVIIQKQAGAIQPYPYEPLPTSFADAMMKVVTSRQEVVGRLSGSINTQDGIPADTAAATVSMILAQEGLKAKVIAKTFARTYVKPLYEKVYNVIKDAGMKIDIPAGTQFKSSPQPTQVDDSITSDQFPNVYDFIVDINTTGDKLIENQQLANTLLMLSQIPVDGGVIVPQTKFNIANRLLEAVNLKAEDYFQDPSKAQPDPQQIAQMKMQEEGVKLQLQKTVADIAKTAAETAKVEAEINKTIADTQVGTTIKMSESLAKMQKMQSDAERDVGKLRLDSIAVGAEIANQEKDITIKQVQTARRAINGIS